MSDPHPDSDSDLDSDPGADPDPDPDSDPDTGAVAVRRIADLSPADRRAVFERQAGVESARETVREVIDRVREEGDAALRAYAREFDDVEIGAIEVTSDAERAVDRLESTLRGHLERAVENVRAFHRVQRPEDWRRSFDGRELGRRFRPVERAGIYVPGGGAAYPSSAIMGVVPAAVAGVEHVAVCTPPAEQLPEVTLAAAHLAGADAVYQVGGAQAIAAMAYGTETVSRVQTVVGPGNRYVTAAKAAVRGDCEIDFLAGPSEVLVVAEGSADPSLVAAELVAQAEHDADAAVAAVTDDEWLANRLPAAIDDEAAGRDREAVVRKALGNDASGVFLARSRAEATLFADEYAAEHLAIHAADAAAEEAILDRIDNAGSVFLGRTTPVAAGDYASGTNHVLPTGGQARVVGGLSVDTFLRATTVQRLDRATLSELRGTITALARAEGLEAHAASVERRFEDATGDRAGDDR